MAVGSISFRAIKCDLFDRFYRSLDPLFPVSCEDADSDPNDVEGRQESSDLLWIDHKGEEYRDDEGSNREVNYTENVFF
jgi:hypothetical protein